MQKFQNSESPEELKIKSIASQRTEDCISAQEAAVAVTALQSGYEEMQYSSNNYSASGTSTFMETYLGTLGCTLRQRMYEENCDQLNDEFYDTASSETIARGERNAAIVRKLFSFEESGTWPHPRFVAELPELEKNYCRPLTTEEYDAVANVVIGDDDPELSGIPLGRGCDREDLSDTEIQQIVSQNESSRSVGQVMPNSHGTLQEDVDMVLSDHEETNPIRYLIEWRFIPIEPLQHNVGGTSAQTNPISSSIDWQPIAIETLGDNRAQTITSDDEVSSQE